MFLVQLRIAVVIEFNQIIVEHYYIKKILQVMEEISPENKRLIVPFI
jgi:hypothetical protein